MHEVVRLLLFNVYMQREEELLSCWWKEYAECSEGPKARPSYDAKEGPQSKASSLMRAQSGEVLEEERVGVPVKGGLYEVLSGLSIFCPLVVNEIRNLNRK